MRLQLVSLPLLIAAAAAATATATASTASSTATARDDGMVRVHRGVDRQLEQDGKANIVVMMHATPQEALLRRSSFPTRGAKIAHLVNQLEIQAKETQRGINNLIAREASSATASPLFEEQHQSWVMNARYFQGATWQLVELLAALPEVAEIREQEIYTHIDDDPATPQNLVQVTSPTANQWGIDRIGAPQVWAQGVNGTGIVVGSIDSGVRATHTLLQRNHRQDYGWFAPGDRSSAPRDQVGHGTHTVGTMVGFGGIGVAPGAQWIACMACATTCTEAAIVQCTEWMLCPTDQSGNNRDCTKAPHVINNSWSTRSGSATHDRIIDAWVAAGIVPVFSNGNKGPSCGTVQSPGDNYNVLSVGNVASDGSLSKSSSRGPSLSGAIKPDLSAPGSLIASASYLNDQELRVVSGTSMAAPHVTGAVALLLSAQPSLSVAEIKELLTTTADTVNVGTVDGAVCGDSSAAGVQWPNNNYGNGILDVHAAYQKLIQGTAPTLPSPTPTTPTTPATPTTPTTRLPTPTTPSTPAPTAPSACKLEYNIDLVGYDIGNARSDSASACCSLCLEFATCRAFTWSDYNGGTCWFKNRATGPRSGSNGAISAAVDRDSSALCRVAMDTDFAGSDLTSVASSKPERCCSLCAERRTQGCKAYTWSTYQGGTCWLKTARGGTTRANGLVSGEYNSM